MEITDANIEVFLDAYLKAQKPYVIVPKLDGAALKSALQAVFDNMGKKPVRAEIAQPEHIEPNNEGWIEWVGGAVTVAAGNQLEAKCDNGRTMTIKGGENGFVFRGSSCPYSIAKYRIIKEESKSTCGHNYTQHPGDVVLECDKCSAIYWGRPKHKVPTFVDFVDIKKLPSCCDNLASQFSEYAEKYLVTK